MPRKGGVPENLKARKKGDPPLPGAGRPKKIPALDVLLADLFGEDEKGKSAARDVLNTLKVAATRGKMSATRLRAAEVIADRVWGKPKSNDTLNVRVQAVDEILSDEKTKATLSKYGLNMRGAQKKDETADNT
jgi:ribosomal protein L25 (general stress protein Ctc)